MAIARTGVFVDDYLEYASTLPAELQRLLNTIRELDERSQGAFFPFLNHFTLVEAFCCYIICGRTQHIIVSGVSIVSVGVLFPYLGKTLCFCYSLRIRAHNVSFIFIVFQIDSHIKRLDEDLTNFAEDLKQDGKISPDEPAILPPLPLVPKTEKRKPFYGTPQPKRLDYRDRDWDLDHDRDFELMPPPGGLKREFVAPVDIDQPIDPNEPTYCVCHQVSFGDMIACDNENCQGGEWFHYSCVGVTPETRFKGKWYCPTCRHLPL
ncbi:PHD finger protein ING2-like [Actinidia eriantha]|uniref:PHD finger protein ING2-like n=1 Tax=Actinidia eriantha TaxID=165200 RepID=UPI002583DC96|nr:PHD finger protein ING2-like [Actinidia eriantha]